MEPSVSRPRAYLLAYSAIPDDPRVRRVGDLLHDNGWDVVGIGLSGWRSTLPAWPIRALDISPAPPAAPAPPRSRLGGVVRNSPLRAVVDQSYKTTRTIYHDALKVGRQARRDFATGTNWRSGIEKYCFWPTYPFISGMRELALRESVPGLWIANDWLMLPVAAAASAHVGGSYMYDSHEFAVEEYAQDPHWLRHSRPVAMTIEGRYIRDARLVTSVSPDITSQLQRLYGLTAPTETIRNVPVYQKQAFRPTGEQIRVLYHGAVAPGRGLEETIDSVSLWRGEFDLTIRGPSSFPGYLDELGARIRELGLASRVEIVPPVPMTQLVASATPFDVGLMALPGHSAHNRFALPNKIFEYMMAGLALCVSDLKSMRQVVDETGAGVKFDSVTPNAIAGTINSLTRERVDAYKQAALAAATRYNWDVEGARLLAALTSIGAARAPRNA